MTTTNQTIPLNRIKPHPDNYNTHPDRQIETLRESLRQFGQVRSVVVQAPAQDNGLYLCVAGHGLTQAAEEEGFVEIRADVLPADWPPHKVKAYLVADNETQKGSDPDLAQLDALIKEIGDIDAELLKAMAVDVDALLAAMKAEDAWGDTDTDFGVDKNAKPSLRQLPIDVIYTLQMADCTCCLAVQAGLKYGIQSSQYSICPYEDKLSGRHKVTFIDNDYFDYNHEKHVAAVKEFRPKYATVMDVITEAQAKKDGVKSVYSLEQILEWAEELNQYAENVIVIPKYDCLDRIPDKFMLGYSVPTSHGGTPLPSEMFQGRRVHLLGGSWKAQLAHMATLGDDVVSIDNNHVLNISRFGQYALPDGETKQLEPSGFGYLNNPRYVALALSFGAIGAKVNELYSAVKEPA